MRVRRRCLSSNTHARARAGKVTRERERERERATFTKSFQKETYGVKGRAECARARFLCRSVRLCFPKKGFPFFENLRVGIRTCRTSRSKTSLALVSKTLWYISRPHQKLCYGNETQTSCSSRYGFFFKKPNMERRAASLVKAQWKRSVSGTLRVRGSNPRTSVTSKPAKTSTLDLGKELRLEISLLKKYRNLSDMRGSSSGAHDLGDRTNTFGDCGNTRRLLRERPGRCLKLSRELYSRKRTPVQFGAWRLRGAASHCALRTSRAAALHPLVYSDAGKDSKESTLFERVAF